MNPVENSAKTHTHARRGAEHEPKEAQPQRLAGLTEPTSRGRSVRRIGEVIVDLGFADPDVVERAVETARERGEPTGKVLVETGVLTHDQLAHAVAERYGLDYVDLSIFKVDMGAANLVEPRVRAPLRGGAGRPTSTSAPCSWRWPTRRTSWRSTTSP